MKRVLITGTGTRGFVGRNLAEAYKDRYTLYTPTSSELDLRDSDAVLRYFDRYRIDVVVHACSSVRDTLDADLKMFFNLERHSRDIEKLIYFGSGAEFDKRFDIVNVCEYDIGRRIPPDGYGFGKYIMNQYTRRSDNIYNLRLFGIFGKYEDWTYKFISNLCYKAVFGLPLSIRRECRFDFIYIDDLPQVVSWVIENKPDYHDYNFVYGQSVLLSTLAETVRKISGKELEIVMLNPEGYNNEYTAANNRLRTQLPWFVPTPMDTAIERLYGWYRDHMDRFDLTVLQETK